MTRLPQEILDIIIDHLASQESCPSPTLSLKACSLTSKSLRRPSRGHLFSHVALKYNTHHLSPASEFRRLSDFKALLDGDRDLVHCIKSLELWVDEFSLLDVHESLLSDIITILYSTPSTSLHALTLRGSQYRPVPWDIIPDYLQAAIYNLCQSGSLDTLEFQYFRKIPLQILLTAHPALHSLSIVDATFDRLNGHPKFRIGTYGSNMGAHTSLKTLSVDRSFSDLLSVIEDGPEPFGYLLESLTSFHIIIDHEDRRLLPVKFLTRLQHLVSLSLFANSHLGPDSIGLDIGALPFLLSLRLHFEVCSVSHVTIALNHVSNLVSRNGSSFVEDITINIDLATLILDSWNTAAITSQAQEIDWTLLDAVFTHERYPKLGRCDIIFKWIGLGDRISVKSRRAQVDSTLSGLLRRCLSPPVGNHPLVRIIIDLEPQ